MKLTQAQPTRKWVSYSKAAGIIRNMILEGSHEPAVLDKAAAVVRQLGRDPAAQAQALWSYVRYTVVYLEDPYGDDHFQGPPVTMARGAGDCDDQVILLGSLLRSIGFQVRLVFVFADQPKNYEADFPVHVYLEVNVAKLDPHEPLWVCADTVPSPDDHGGFYYARFGSTYPAGFREYVEVN